MEAGREKDSRGEESHRDSLPDRAKQHELSSANLLDIVHRNPRGKEVLQARTERNETSHQRLEVAGLRGDGCDVRLTSVPLAAARILELRGESPIEVS